MSNIIIEVFRRVILAWLSVRLDLVVRGLDNVPRTGPAILIANHPSAIDGLLLASIVPRGMRGFSRPENFDGLVAGPFMRMSGALAASNEVHDQRALEQNLRSLERARRWIERGQVFVSTPEGDVNSASTLLEFKWGAIFLASDLGVPVVPVIIVGSEDALSDPRRPSVIQLLWSRRARVRIHFMPPLRFETAPVDGASLALRVEHVRRIIQAESDEIRRASDLDVSIGTTERRRQQ